MRMGIRHTVRFVQAEILARLIEQCLERKTQGLGIWIR